MGRQVFVARERELGQLDGFLNRALACQGQVCFVTGEAGSGKTALVTEFARRAEQAHTDLVVAIGNCNAQTGVADPYLPFREILGLLTGDVEAKKAQGDIFAENASRLRDFLRTSGEILVELGPDLIDIFVPGVGLATRGAALVAGKVGWLETLEKLIEHKAPGPGDTDLEQSHIFEQHTNVLKALAAQQLLMLVVDDLHWADAASISLLFHLGRRIGGSRILIVGTYRPEEVALGRAGERHPLEKVLAEFRRYFGEIGVDLDQSGEAERQHFVDDFLGTEPHRLGEGFRRALYHHTSGNPLFTIELLRAMQERGDLVQDEQGRWVEGPALDWEDVPTRVEGVIDERIGRLEEELRDILTVASVEGEDFTAQVVARVREADERDLVGQLGRELDRRHRLVREGGSRQVGRQRVYLYRFRHSLFQQHLYNKLGEIERELLHRDVGAVLEELYGERAEEIAPQLAWHFAEAGERQKAAEYLLRAGDQARLAYAHQEAIGHYERALAFLKEEGDYQRAARTLMKLGLTYHTAFDFRQACQAYDEGFALWNMAGEAQEVSSLPPAPHALRVPWLNPPTLDPTMGDDVLSALVIAQLFSGLVELRPDMGVVPDIARTWQVLEGGHKYVFHLRDDVRWSDRTPVTAGDFEYTWKRALDPPTESPAASLLYPIKGARALHQGEMSDPNLVGVRALDEAILAVELERPTGYFLHVLANPVTYPLPRYVVETYGEAWTEVENIVTNGPFRLEAWQRGQSMVLVRNPEYHGQFGGNLQRIALTFITHPSAQSEIHEADGLDIFHLWGLPPSEMDHARQRHVGEYASGPEMGTVFVGFDVSRPPFDDLRVRRAFALAADRETLAHVVMRGYAFPATGGFVPPGMPGHSTGIGLPHDPEGARQLMAEAGYPEGCGFPVVDCPVPVAMESEIEYLQAQWRENLGVEITSEIMEWSLFTDRLERQPPHMFGYGWLADYPDPDSFLMMSPFRRQTRWRNETYDGLVEAARCITDQEERMRRYGQADRILIERAAIVPLTYARFHLLVKPWVTKYPTSPICRWFWKDVIIEPH